MNYPVSLEPIQGARVDQLVDILNNDQQLSEFLTTAKAQITSSNFTENNAVWSQKNNAKMFAIVLGNNAIGMISLSHINLFEKSAQVGYWLSSSNWNKGYTSAAFSQMLTLAKNTGISSVSCKVNKNNLASKAIWSKNNATFIEENGLLLARICL